ncbi:MAG: hypothetical protein HY314_15470 [Acidobacteria bacterium]|nr:hypothetical protein [Acidobacteriota bacterium]
MKRSFCLLLLSLTVFQVAYSQVGSFQDWVRLFDYDQKLPPDVKRYCDPG